MTEPLQQQPAAAQTPRERNSADYVDPFQDDAEVEPSPACSLENPEICETCT